MTYLLIITLAPSPIPSQIPHTLFDIISLGVVTASQSLWLDSGVVLATRLTIRRCCVRFQTALCMLGAHQACYPLGSAITTIRLISVLMQHQYHHEYRYWCSTNTDMYIGTDPPPISPWISVLMQHQYHHEYRYWCSTNTDMCIGTDAAPISPWKSYTTKEHGL